MFFSLPQWLYDWLPCSFYINTGIFWRSFLSPTTTVMSQPNTISFQTWLLRKPLSEKLKGDCFKPFLPESRERTVCDLSTLLLMKTMWSILQIQLEIPEWLCLNKLWIMLLWNPSNNSSLKCAIIIKNNHEDDHCKIISKSLYLFFTMAFQFHKIIVLSE